MDQIEPIVGNWYYVDRIDGARQEEVLAVRGSLVVVRNTRGDVDKVSHTKLVCVAPKPFSVIDVLHEQSIGWPIALAVLAWSAWREIRTTGVWQS